MRRRRIWLGHPLVWMAVVLNVVNVVVAGAEEAEDAPTTRSGSPPPPADAVIAVLPFEESPSSRIFVNLAPDGNRPFTVMLDTGAAFTVFTPRFARSLGVSIRRTKSTPYRRATHLGRDLQFYIDTSSSDTASKTGWEYGLLGGNFLSEYVVEFNFATRQVTFLNPRKFRVPKKVEAPNEDVLPIRVVSGRPIVKIGMNGKSIGVLLDTGAPPPLIMSGATVKKLGMDVDSLQPFGMAGTVMGTTPASLFETDNFTLGKFEFGPTPVTVLPKGWHNQGANSGSVIGYDTLRQFTIRIDYPRERMWLRRESTMVTYDGIDYGATRKAGIFLYAYPTDYRVYRVLPDTPASRLGLQPGDVLTGADRKAPPDIDELIEKIVAGGPLEVRRQVAEDLWEVAVLPEGSTLPGVASQDGMTDAQRREGLAQQARERDAGSAEKWEEEKKEALYYQRDGLWMKVDAFRVEKGPKADETWVNFDEMQRIKRAAEGENQG